MTIIQARFDEAAALLPMLYASPAKKNRVAVAGVPGQDAEVAAEALRWRDVSNLYLLNEPKDLKDRRIEVVEQIPEVDVLISLPGSDHTKHLGSLAKDGIVNAMVNNASAWGQLRRDFSVRFGTAVPWREYLPEPFHGVLAKNGSKPQQTRPVPGKAKRLSKQYLPCLFVFGKDEMPVAFTQPQAKMPTGVAV